MTNWFKSSYSYETGACLEASLTGTDMLMRDSQNPQDPFLGFDFAEWKSFVDSVV